MPDASPRFRTASLWAAPLFKRSKHAGTILILFKPSAGSRPQPQSCRLSRRHVTIFLPNGAQPSMTYMESLPNWHRRVPAVSFRKFNSRRLIRFSSLFVVPGVPFRCYSRLILNTAACTSYRQNCKFAGTPSFCQYLRAHVSGAKIHRLAETPNDRIVWFELHKKETTLFLVLALTGRSANVFVLDSQTMVLRSLKPSRQSVGQPFDSLHFLVQRRQTGNGSNF